MPAFRSVIFLHFYATSHGIQDAWKFQKQAVADRLDDASSKFGDFRVHQFSAMCLQGCQHALLINAHKS
jgi:hypothetical protein